jgi:MFS superfamily sulfate permease-like transporter
MEDGTSGRGGTAMRDANGQLGALPEITSPMAPAEPRNGTPGGGFFSEWRSDLPAAVVVFLVAVPLCLGIALASGAPLFSGIIAGVVGGVVVGLLSGSQLMVSGPAAGLTAIVIAGIQDVGSFEAFLVAVVLGGLLQIVLSVLRAGIIGYYFPSSVIKGMLAAIGLILILKQFPHAVGYDADVFGDQSFQQANQENTFTAIAHAFRAVQPGAVIVSLIGLVVLVAWNQPALKRLKRIPAPLVVVLLGVGLNALFAAVAPALAIRDTHLVTLPVAASVGEFLTQFTMPDWSALRNPAVYMLGVTIALVASLETLLSLEATDKMDPYKREAPTNRELLAQGVGNTVSGLVGGLPITGVIVRSSANIDSGAKTKLSAVLHGLLLFGAVVAIPGLLNHIPLAALAAVLLFTGYKLAHPALFRTAWRIGRYHFVPFVVTIVAILLTDLLVGISIGLAVGVFFILLDNLKAQPLVPQSPPGAVLKRYALPEQVTFLNKASIVTMLEALPPGSRIEIDGRNARHVDYDVLEVIHDFKATARSRNIDYRLVGVPSVPTTPSHSH